MSDEIRIIPFEEMLKLRFPEIHNTVITRYAGWKISGPYCPGKAGYHTFMAEKDGKRLLLHFDDIDFSVTEEK